MKPEKVANIRCHNDAAEAGRERELFGILPAAHSGAVDGEHVESRSHEAPYQVPIGGVLVQVKRYQAV